MALQLVTKSAEVKLMEALHDMQDAGKWKAVHFHLENLLEQYQSEYQIKIAINLIHDLLRDREGHIFLLADHGLIVLCRDLDAGVQNKLIFQLRYLYMDDPLAYAENGQENPGFCDSFDLGRDWQRFFDAASQKMARTIRKSAGSALPPAQPSPQPVMSIQSPVNAPQLRQEDSLKLLETSLRRIDLLQVFRRQPVCAAKRDGAVRRVFDELYLHIPHLRQLLGNSGDFFSNRWLFKYLTLLLDQRMMAMIRDNPASFLSSPVSLNLNVETLLSSWFTDFDAAISPAAKVSVVIEVPVLDAFADINGFMTARDEVQKLGYRICLDGLTAGSFTQIDRGKLGADLIKLQWNADVRSDLHNQDNKRLAEAIESAGTNRVILCRCDNRQAVEYGQALGIPLFQGRYLDSLVNPTASVAN